MDVKARVEIIKLRDAFERDRAGFIKKWKRKENAQRKVIESARERVNEVETPSEVLEYAAELCMKLGTDGLRGELTLLRASRALAALKKQDSTSTEHLRSVAGLVLRHRLRRDPLDEATSDIRIERALASMPTE